MTPRPHESTQWLETIDDFIAGRLDSAALHDFQERLRTDEQARLVYIEYLDLHFELLQGAGGLASAESVVRSARAPRYGKLLAAGAAAAVLVAVGWGLWSKGGQPQVAVDAVPVITPTDHGSVPTPAVPTPPPIAAQLVRVTDAKWTDLDVTPALGDRLRVGDILDFTGGSVEVRFESGARASLIATEGGTARLRLTSTNGCLFESGCATFSVPPDARGFTVETVGGRFVDHGTEFGVSADPRGECQVHVLEGLVEALTRQPSSPVMLHEGSAVTVDGRGEAAVPVAFRPEQFLIPATLGWGIEKFSGSVRPHLVPPLSLERSANLDTSVAHLVLEHRDFDVKSGWQNQSESVVEENDSGKSPAGSFSVTTNSKVDSYLVHVSAAAGGRRDLAGEIRFHRPIVAVITDTEDLRRSRDVFRNARIQYDDSTGFGLETKPVGPADRIDVIELADDRHTLRYSLNVGNAVDEFRVLVAADDAASSRIHNVDREETK